ncbi:MAG: hypothetical protein HQL95_01780 [Magnetococcales bacterium]|nr:hypothetical protein [Magnetococcales bacterium]
MFTLKFDQSSLSKLMATTEKQVKYATAVALTKTAKDIQSAVREDLPNRFTIRTGWVAKGIIIKPATKTNLVAEVCVKDDFMKIQESGGEKTEESGKSVSIPFAARQNKQDTTRPSKFPRALLGKEGFFIAPLSTKKNGSARHGVWQRYGRKIIMKKGKYVGKKRQQIRLMYAFQHSVLLKPRFGFYGISSDIATKRIKVRFSEALKDAISTSK